jgi:hypothetical protein
MLEIYLGFHFQAAKRNDETPYGLGHDIITAIAGIYAHELQIYA